MEGGAIKWNFYEPVINKLSDLEGLKSSLKVGNILSIHLSYIDRYLSIKFLPTKKKTTLS